MSAPCAWRVLLAQMCTAALRYAARRRGSGAWAPRTSAPQPMRPPRALQSACWDTVAIEDRGYLGVIFEIKCYLRTERLHGVSAPGTCGMAPRPTLSYIPLTGQNEKEGSLQYGRLVDQAQIGMRRA